MKVLHVINGLATGGAEKLVVDFVPLLQEKGVEVDVLCMKAEQTSFLKELESKSNGKIFGLSSGLVYNPLLIFKMIPYLKKYDLIHVHLFPAFYWVVLAKWVSFSKIKIVFTEHNTSNKRMENKFFRLLDLVIYRGIRKNITIAEKVDENLKAHLKGFDASKFELIHNGVPVEQFIEVIGYPATDFFSATDFILIQVSSFRAQKDQPTLIKSLLQLPENIKLLLVGDGALRIENEKLVTTLQLENRVQFLGLRTDIPQLLKTADVAVLSSHYEGLSLSSIEGMAARPFIASNVQGLKEIVGGYGLLFEQGNEKDLATKILELYNDKVYYQKIAHQCLMRAQEFDIQKMTDAYLKLYLSIHNEIER